ncbi:MULTISPECIES: hypothetical protein [Bacillus]|uniref:hypothetical protein n=1 Tax=Bacillus TaxID=1386 RepID=UPI000814BC9F|nr:MULTISPECIES: hypothetical protein [Bacillus]MDU0071437.1 hypothetical protein [Bacillus sp. IG6]SCA86137.1 hypothetical protein BGLY_2314 [Bacillus glycinifermentans]
MRKVWHVYVYLLQQAGLFPRGEILVCLWSSAGFFMKMIRGAMKTNTSVTTFLPMNVM